MVRRKDQIIRTLAECDDDTRLDDVDLWLEEMCCSVAEPIWNCVAFGNFIQDLLVDRSSDHRPTAQQWSEARSAFLDLLDALRPDAVLVLGEGIWMSLSFPAFPNSKPVPSAIKDDGSQPFLYVWTRPAGYRVLATWVNHPTGSFGFQLSKWAPRVATLLEAASNRAEA